MPFKSELASIGSMAAGPVHAGSAEPSQQERQARGEKMIAAITGSEGKKVVESLGDIAPALGEWIVNFAYGDVFSRPGLSLCTRELTTISALTALGNAQPQLKVHIEGALNGISAAREVFTKRGIKLAVKG